MCLIIYSPNGKIPRKHINRGLAANCDGWGFMVATKDGVRVAKGLTVAGFWEYWNKRPEGPVVWHARIGTQGGTTIDNCHPFPVPGHNGLWVAHNGIIQQYSGYKKTALSDTRMFVQDILTGMPRGFLNNESCLKLIEDFIGWSKLVFMNAAGEVFILNESLGNWSGQRWYSNDSWKPVARAFLATSVEADTTHSCSIQVQANGGPLTPPEPPNNTAVALTAPTPAKPVAPALFPTMVTSDTVAPIMSDKLPEHYRITTVKPELLKVGE